MRLISLIIPRVEPRAPLTLRGVPWRCISTGDIRSVVYPGWYSREAYSPGTYHHGTVGSIYG